MVSKSFGTLINKDGHGHYTNPNDTKNVIRYVTRTNGRSADDLIAWGGLGVLEHSGVESVIDQFYLIQKLHTRRGNFGKYVSHEIFSFSDVGERLISENNLDIDTIARKMAYDIFEQDHCQVIYGVHAPNNNEKHLHVHFAINAVNFHTGNKRRENKTQTRERDKRFNNIISDEILEKRMLSKFLKTQ